MKCPNCKAKMEKGISVKTDWYCPACDLQLKKGEIFQKGKNYTKF